VSSCCQHSYFQQSLSRYISVKMAQPLRAAILIVSTTAAKDPSTDASAGVLREVFDAQGAGKWEVKDTQIVSDNVLDIQRQISTWADGPDGPNLIITTGGTGFAIADYTPEVSRSFSCYEQSWKPH
jgi:gephyrin